MPAPLAAAIDLTDVDRSALVRMTRASSVRTSLAQRAHIVLLAGEGTSNTEIAELVGVSRPTVILWRKRFQDQGIAGLHDEPRQGRPRHVNHERIIAATLNPPPAGLGLTHWSSRSLARWLGVGNATVARCWREYGVQPSGSDTFHFSTAPELTGTVIDVLGLALAPRGNAIMLSFSHTDVNHGRNRVERTSQVRSAHVKSADHENVPRALAARFTALESVKGVIVGTDDQSAPDVDFQRFVQYFTKSHPGQELHLVMDREANFICDKVLECFKTNLRSFVHVTTSHTLWQRLVAVWFEMIERQTSGGDHGPLSTDVITSIGGFLTESKVHGHKGTWINEPSWPLSAGNCQETSHTSHARPRLAPDTDGR